MCEPFAPQSCSRATRLVQSVLPCSAAVQGEAHHAFCTE